MPQSEWVKDPEAVLDYCFDWAALTNGTGTSDWLAELETIADFSIAITPVTASPLTEDSSALSDADTSVTVWLSGGLAGTEYRVTCHIETSNATPREDDRTMKSKVRDR